MLFTVSKDEWNTKEDSGKTIKRRIGDIFESKDAVIAALFASKFQMKWVDSQENKDDYNQQ